LPRMSRPRHWGNGIRSSLKSCGVPLYSIIYIPCIRIDRTLPLRW
jgi:hypothetical protein